MKYTPVIGLEVHVELATNSKMFCACSANYFGQKPNTYTCPVCLGLPGALPVPNKKALDWCIKISLALNCEIQQFSKFDRKNYFYPDLAKGYQISQYDKPFGLNGSINIVSDNDQERTIRIRRVHMEEDTGKLIHATIGGEKKSLVQRKASLIDFNRSGVPLVEIVTEPDFENATEVKNYLQSLQQIVRYLGVSNADMEKGDMRLEPNISLRDESSNELPKYKVEVKNINSFRFVEKAINFEIERQKEILDSGKTPTQETRGWDELTNTTVSQREKEEAHDYRYFPEPDIPPIVTSNEEIETLKKEIPEMPKEKIERFVSEYSLSNYNAEILTREMILANFFEQAVKDGKEFNLSPKQIANYIINKKTNVKTDVPADIVKQIVTSGQKVKVNEGKLKETISKVLEEHKQAVEDYKKGKVQVLGFLIGQVRKEIKENIDTEDIKTAIEELL